MLLPQLKALINTEAGAKIKDRDTPHRAIADNPGATAEDRNKRSRYDHCIVIKHAKGQYRNKVESYYTGYDARYMWQGLQSIMDYKGRPSHDLPNDDQTNSMHFMHASIITNNTLSALSHL